MKMGNLAILPTPAAVEAAWHRYAELARQTLDHNELLLNRSHMEAMARAEKAWKDSFLAMET